MLKSFLIECGKALIIGVITLLVIALLTTAANIIDSKIYGLNTSVKLQSLVYYKV